MSTEREILVAQKAAMFDLIQILKQQPDKAYTVDELEALIVAYIKGAGTGTSSVSEGGAGGSSFFLREKM